MRAKLAEDIQALTQLIIEANDAGDEAAEEATYERLRQLCHDSRNSNRNHPLQWEALGDFAASFDDAVAAYEEGLQLAQKFKMQDFIASIQFALAEAFHHNGDDAKAREWLASAEDAVQSCDDYQLKGAITEFRTELDS
ncbi:MAG: hypothetical protein R3332_00550 [Pseudohongiellaceae bacterium]|nr:hypothetical protein [Pseudohongiellaceae bacterium]